MLDDVINELMSTVQIFCNDFNGLFDALNKEMYRKRLQKIGKLRLYLMQESGWWFLAILCFCVENGSTVAIASLPKEVKCNKTVKYGHVKPNKKPDSRHY